MNRSTEQRTNLMRKRRRLPARIVESIVIERIKSYESDKINVSDWADVRARILNEFKNRP